AIIWTCLVVMAVVGSLAGVAGIFSADAIASYFGHGDAELRSETAAALRVLSVSVPLVILSLGVRGILEAFGRFGAVNRISVPVSVLNILTPVIMVGRAATLSQIVCALVGLRCISLILLLREATRVVPAMRRFGISTT